MTTQLHQAFGIVAARAHQAQDPALLRDLELARQADRRARRVLRRRTR
ncbi:hypothetical protein GCM10009844_31800 [Nocardioides koreensis]|uniref:Uncharacterized protein n=1 Tax=Nocardioides koreensis TaxID=433651 RepID=A0ABP5LPU5_9ACTN